MNKVAATQFLTSLLAIGLIAPSASAHISLDQGGTHQSRYGDAQLKVAPCGEANGARGTHIYTYRPGETITVSFKEFIAHPSYFRFAFDEDGDGDFRDPASIQPIDPARPCPIDLGDKCGASDFYGSPTVLPGMDDLDPHLANAAKSLNTYQVTLPNVECDNCTLQVIQVMEDNFLHGDYNPNPSDPNDTGLLGHVPDIYHQCIDLVLTSGAAGGASSGGASGGGASGGGAGGAGSTEPSGVGGTENADPGAGGNPSGVGGETGANPPAVTGGAPGANGGGPATTNSGDGATAKSDASPSSSSSGCGVVRGGQRGSDGACSLFGLALAIVGLRRRTR